MEVTNFRSQNWSTNNSFKIQLNSVRCTSNFKEYRDYPTKSQIRPCGPDLANFRSRFTNELSSMDLKYDQYDTDLFSNAEGEVSENKFPAPKFLMNNMEDKST